VENNPERASERRKMERERESERDGVRESPLRLAETDRARYLGGGGPITGTIHPILNITDYICLRHQNPSAALHEASYIVLMKPRLELCLGNL
jgi:hypothetical protein